MVCIKCDNNGYQDKRHILIKMKI